jgi:oxygen-independent coproporphyrinogen-3 oxidase
MAQKKTRATFRIDKGLDFMVVDANHNSEISPERRNGRSSSDTIGHLYVHIPFCARICPYCAFYKELLDRSETQRFCEAILRELQSHAKNRVLRPTTIYFGGGTPTALTSAQLDYLLTGFHRSLDLSQLIEWTMEANPGSVSARKAGLLRQLGVTRISLGVQSWDDDLLKLLGREHDSKQVDQSFQILRGAGFENVNVDLMFGLPGQSISQWRETLERTIALGPEHVSTYCLTYEEDTEFFLRHARGEFRQNEDADAEFLDLAMSMLESAGYEHYEISNYAKPEFRSLHNRGYWSGADYLGIGPSAFSTIGMNRFQNIPNFRKYSDAVLSAECAIGSVEHLTDEMKRSERVALGLRTNTGVPERLLESFEAETREFVRLGLLQKADDRFVLTRAGKALADSVAAELV